VPERNFALEDHYWRVNKSNTQVYSSAKQAYVPVTDPDFIAWNARDDKHVTNIVSQPELFSMLMERDINLLPDNHSERLRVESIKNQADRQTYIDELKTRTADEIENFIRTRVDADSVTDVASAKDCMKRIETGMVRLLQLMAFIVKE
jgi:hypothetical protein